MFSAIDGKTAQRVLECAPDAMVAISEDGFVVFVNSHLEKLFRQAGEALLGRHIGTLVPELLRQKHCAKRKSQLYDPGYHYTETGCVLLALRPDGEEFPVEISVSRASAVDPKLTLYTIRDVSERDQAELALRHQREFTDALLDTIGALVVVLDVQGRIVRFNRACEQVSGYSYEEVQGETVWSRLIAPEDTESVQSMFVELCAGCFPSTFENRWLTKDRMRRLIAWSNTALLDEVGQVKYIIGTGIDITERTEAEQALRDSEQRIRSILNSVMDGLITIDERGSVQAFNRAAQDMFGYAPEEVVGRNVRLLMPEPYHSEHDDYLRHYRETGEAKIIGIGREVAGRRKDGSTFPMDLAVSEMRLGEQRYFVGVTRDITERRKAENALRESDQRLRSIWESVLDGLITVNGHGIIQGFNTAAQRMFGYAPQEVLGRDVKLLVPKSFHHEYDRYLHAYQQSEEQEIIGIGREVCGRRKDGSIFPVDLAVSQMCLGAQRYLIGVVRDITDRKNAMEQLNIQSAALESAANAVMITDRDGKITWVNPAFSRLTGYQRNEMLGRTPNLLRSHQQDPATYSQLWETIQAGQAWTGELTNQRKDGSTYVEEQTVTPVRNETGEISHFIAVKEDITKRKEIDRMKNEFISTVSHELRTPLTSVQGSLGLILGGMAGSVPQPVRDLLDIAAKNGDRLVRLINDILDIEKIESGNMVFDLEPLELAPLVRQAVESNDTFARQHGVAIVTRGDAAQAVIMADSDRLTQVVINLLANAVKFSPEGGSVRVELRVYGGSVRISVSDQGPGIAEEFRDRVFEKFSQADASDRRQKGGTGLGLSISKAIVEAMAGRIWFETRLGSGTTFHVDLPRKSGHEHIEAVRLHTA